MVLARSPLAEAGLLVTVLTPELGLIRARAEGARRSGAKLAHALQTLNESDLMLVRGKEGWRLTGAVLAENRFAALTREGRTCVARVSSLLMRLVGGDTTDPALHTLFIEFVTALPTCSKEETAHAESLVVLRLLHALGFDGGETPPAGYAAEALTYAQEARTELISRINRGISASGA